MNTFLSPLVALLGSFAFCGCFHTPGSVSHNAISEALASPRMALTPSQPAWLLGKKDIHPLNDDQLAQARNLLRQSRVRVVPERFYRSQEEGNRGDSTHKTFYLYASNAQCLGGRIIENRALMDDLDMSIEQEQALYQLLLPQLKLLKLADY